MNAPAKLTPAIPAAFDPKAIARNLVRAHSIANCADLLVALVEAMDCELQHGWLTQDRDIAEGSLEADAAGDAVREFRSYVGTLSHPDLEWSADRVIMSGDSV